jgi:hypothetical protein
LGSRREAGANFANKATASKDRRIDRTGGLAYIGGTLETTGR